MSVLSNQNIIPFLWFNNQAEEAISFYTSLFPNSSILNLKKWGPGSGFPEDKVMMGECIIDGLKVHAFDAGPQFKFNESVSFFVLCKDQAEIDKYWYALTEEGEESMCGWLKDKWGFSWQIVPAMLNDRLTNGEPLRVKQMFEALMKMKKLDVAALDAAYNK
jgi:predicted 3-demethylubiquinone-9 3-methyltransferase (glyoxalase superfamily)